MKNIQVLILTLFFCLGSDLIAGENKLISLYDNIGDMEEAIPDWGFAVLIQYNGKMILFDGGASASILQHNAGILEVDLKNVDIAILSHSHFDHLSGLDYLLKVNPDVEIFLPNDWTLGAGHSQESLENNKKYKRGYRFPEANITFVGESTEIGPGMSIIATSSSLTGWFFKYPPYQTEPALRGLPELSLAIQGEDEAIILVVGCSHSGIENIVRETGQYLEQKVTGIAGGFHLGPYSPEYISDVAKLMKDELHVNWVAPTHCTGDAAREVFKTVFEQDNKDFGLGYSIVF